MSGFKRLPNDIRREMVEDARDRERGEAFRAARRQSEEMDPDEYIRFLSDSMGYARPRPTRRRTGDFRL